MFRFDQYVHNSIQMLIFSKTRRVFGNLLMVLMETFSRLHLLTIGNWIELNEKTHFSGSRVGLKFVFNSSVLNNIAFRSKILYTNFLTAISSLTSFSQTKFCGTHILEGSMPRV